MSLHEVVEELIRNLRASGRSLARAQELLRGRRVAWLSPEPGALQASADELKGLAEASAELERKRQELLQQLADLLPLRALPGRSPQLTVSRIAARLPAPLGARLRQAAADTSRLARGARLETTLGRRLLEVSATAQEGFFRGLVGLGERDSATSYDRNAKTRRDARGRSGTLIDGRA